MRKETYQNVLENTDNEHCKKMFKQLHDKERKEILVNFLINSHFPFPERNCKIMFLYYGDELTMREIALQMKITPARVGQIISKMGRYIRRDKEGLLREIL